MPGEHMFGMIRTQNIRHLPGIGRFIQPVIGKPNGKGAHGGLKGDATLYFHGA
jgi:hypothetical protein